MNTKNLFAACIALGFLGLPIEAYADRSAEIGGFVGAHIFNDDNELGVHDQSNAESLNNAFAFGIRAAYAVIGQLDIEGELVVIPTTSTVSDVDVVGLGWRAHALYHLVDGKVRPFLLLGAGGVTAASEDDNRFGSDTDLVAHAGVGVKYDIQDNWGVRLDARLLLPPSSADEFATVDAEFFLGLYKTFGGEEPVKEEKQSAPLDTDGDGINDADDQCPAEAEDLDGDADDDGCPEEDKGPSDSDGDGITDDIDGCPNETEDLDGFKDEDGCPDVDNDGDGLLDAEDQCPNKLEDKDGFEDEDGCPDPDNDNDGVLDADDQCPTELETKNGYKDSDGCADQVPAAVQKFSGAIEGIRFKTNSAKIRPASFRTLNKAVKVLKEFGEVKLEIQGHTDSSGDAEKNLSLSQERAQSVVDYLVGKGIAADRLAAKGYGSTVSVADNATKAGMEKNRRVEFKLISQ